MAGAQTIALVCELLASGYRTGAVRELAMHYALPEPATARRSWSKLRLTRLFLRDRFTDCYTGLPLIFPSVLRALTVLLPAEFPCHPNWKQTETHPAYWELYPSLDHVIPVARGGADDESNVVTTSMVRNAAKGNWLLDELHWPQPIAAPTSDWDGGIAWLLSSFEREAQLRADASASAWYRVAKVATDPGLPR